MDAQRKLRAGIIGYGISGKLSHAYGLNANPEDFEIVAVCDLSPERRADADKDLGCPTFTDHQALLDATPDLDLVSVVTRSDTHCQIASDCLRAGINTLITKPWALNEAEAETILAAQREGGARLFPWVPVYWSEEFRKIKELLEAGRIGKPFLIRRQLGDFRRREDWQTDRQFGGGYLLNWGPHILPPILALAPSPLASLHGQLQKVINPGDADDAFLAVLRFEDGCLGLAEFAQACEGLHSLFVQGDHGMIQSDGKTVTLLEKDPSDTEPPRRTRFTLTGKPFGDEAEIYRDVARTLRDGTSFSATPEDALFCTRTLDAIRASHDSQHSVTLPTPALR